MKLIERRYFLRTASVLAGGVAAQACGSGGSGDSAQSGQGGQGAQSGQGGQGGAQTSASSGQGGAGGGDPMGDSYEYIVVGSGAGGGPLASNLARQGHSVLLLEAGEDHGDKLDYQVPVFHTIASEDPDLSWNYYVHHYDDPAREAQDSKFVGAEGGVLYPRCGTLGGCTAHNAMITVYPHESDWDHIADLTGDDSWRPDAMRKYYQVLERCQYLDPATNPPGHGFSGWLRVNRAPASLVVGDGKLEGLLLSAANAQSGFFGSVSALYNTINADLNEAGPGRDQKEAMFTIPLATDGRKRNGPREYILSTIASGAPLKLTMNALVSRVLFSVHDAPDGKKKAIGVEYLDGKHLYRADPNAPKTGAGGATKIARATREVILCAGAFNTPQLLKLSGVGPKDELSPLGIDLHVDLPGVGANLQDRYEVTVSSIFENAKISLIQDCTFGQPGDPCLADWQNGGGPYVSNGAIAGIVKRSTPDKPLPDLFIFGLPGFFKGYEPGYSLKGIADRSHFSWAVLKAHTGNTAGRVELLSKDPRDVPKIRFKYFDEGTNDAGQADEDVQAVVEGMKFARDIMDKTSTLLFAEDIVEEVPGPSLADDASLRDFVKREAWGHHASCTCKIGGDGDKSAVLDSKFRVRGTTGLRVVDASVFPKIPGFFIVVPIYMVSEKATDQLLADIGETRHF